MGKAIERAMLRGEYVPVSVREERLIADAITGHNEPAWYY